MQAIFRGHIGCVFWALLQPKEEIKDLFLRVSRSLEIVAMELFASNGCKHSKRLCSS
jgi:hypothetical protein